MLSFPCNKCGLCCEKVGLADETKFLDRGDNMCRYYDESTKMCTIYETRPDVCRVDVKYAKSYSDSYSWEEFVELNAVSCRVLQILAVEK